MRAKAHWGYSDEVLEGWRAELAVSPQGIRARPTFVAMVGIEVAGFYSLSPLGRSWELDHLWVLPRFMRLGVGRALLSHALETAARAGAAEVTVDADPNAEPFYLECGAVRRGAVPAPLPGQPLRARPQLTFNAKPVSNSVSRGGCQCGSIRYEFSGNALELYVCHCKECQKQSASAFGISVIVPRGAFRVTRGTATFWSRPTDTGHMLECAFCANCGSRLWHQRRGAVDTISVKGGSLDETVDLRRAVHIWTSRILPGITVPEGAAQFPGEPE